MKLLRYIKRGLQLVVVLLSLLFVVLFFTTRGPHRGSSINITYPEPEKWSQVNQLQVGVGVRDITPKTELYDSWVDVNADGKFDPETDQYVDKNGNGTFDLIGLLVLELSGQRRALMIPYGQGQLHLRTMGQLSF